MAQSTNNIITEEHQLAASYYPGPFPPQYLEDLQWFHRNPKNGISTGVSIQNSLLTVQLRPSPTYESTVVDQEENLRISAFQIRLVHANPNDQDLYPMFMGVVSTISETCWFENEFNDMEKRSIYQVLTRPGTGDLYAPTEYPLVKLESRWLPAPFFWERFLKDAVAEQKMAIPEGEKPYMRLPFTYIMQRILQSDQEKLDAWYDEMDEWWGLATTEAERERELAMERDRDRRRQRAR